MRVQTDSCVKRSMKPTGGWPEYCACQASSASWTFIKALARRFRPSRPYVVYGSPSLGHTVPGMAGTYNVKPVRQRTGSRFDPSASEVEGDGTRQRLLGLCRLGIRRLVRLVVLDFETLEDAGMAAVEHRRVEKIGASDPAIEGLEVAPRADEDNLFAAVGMGLTSKLRVDEALMPAGVEQGQLSLLPKQADL